jgi:2-aminoethylphosphonate-pyruvate transaminase
MLAAHPRPMIDFEPADTLGRRVLFTPGPVTCSRTVLEAAMKDVGSWDADTTTAVREISKRLLGYCGDRPDLTVTLIPGSGTYGVESMLAAAAPAGGTIIVLSNGLYGRRLAELCKSLGIKAVVVEQVENKRHDHAALDAALRAHPEATHVATCHCETSAGILNRLDELGPVVAKHGKRLLVDAMASFCGYPVGKGLAIDFDRDPIDHIVASANKCAQGIPGISYVISRRAALEAAAPMRSMSLDLKAQHTLMDATGRFRFTPPTHVVLALQQALRELDAEGGPAARAARYKENQRLVIERLGKLGIKPYVEAEHRSHINSTFPYPPAPFAFEAFKDALRARGYIIFPQKVTQADAFRIGSIGNIGPAEVIGLTNAIADALNLPRPD